VGTAAAALGREAAKSMSDTLSFAATLASGPAEVVKEPEIAKTAASDADCKAACEQAVERFRESAYQRLTAAGVDLSQPIELQSDGLGGIQVAGEHPDRALIEQTLSGDLNLQQQFRSLAEKYAQANPSLDPRDYDFGVTLTGSSAQVSVAER